MARSYDGRWYFDLPTRPGLFWAPPWMVVRWGRHGPPQVPGLYYVRRDGRARCIFRWPR